MSAAGEEERACYHVALIEDVGQFLVAPQQGHRIVKIVPMNPLPVLLPSYFFLGLILSGAICFCCVRLILYL